MSDDGRLDAIADAIKPLLREGQPFCFAYADAEGNTSTATRNIKSATDLALLLLGLLHHAIETSRMNRDAVSEFDFSACHAILAHAFKLELQAIDKASPSVATHEAPEKSQ